MDNWIIELRWSCSMLHTWSFTMYKRKEKPTKVMINTCYVLAPIFWLFHWLIIVPVCMLFYAVLFIGLILITVLSWLFVRLGELLQNMIKL